MKLASLILIAVLFAGCIDIRPTGPLHGSSQIVVSVHWQSQGVPGIPVVLVQTRDSVVTGTNGLAIFSAPAGHYIVRAYGINRGGPVFISTDYDVEAHEGETAIVDIVDCLPCL
jgi:hypothetical protein